MVFGVRNVRCFNQAPPNINSKEQLKTNLDQPNVHVFFGHVKADVESVSGDVITLCSGNKYLIKKAASEIYC